MKIKDFNLKFSRVIVICLIVSVLTGVVAYAVSPTQPFTINRGIYPGATSYTIWVDDGNYFAKNQFGTIIYEGTNAATVIQASIDSLTTGGTIYFSNQRFVFTTPIDGKNSVNLIGESKGPFENFDVGTVLDYAGGSDSGNAFIDYRACRNVEIRNLKIYNSGGNDINGIYMGDTTNSIYKTKEPLLENIVVDGFTTGLLGDVFGPDEITLIHVYVGNNVIGVDNLSNMRCFGGSIYENEQIGLRIRRAAGDSADASLVATGTTWSGNPVQIDVAGYQSINIITLDGCWFENTATMLIDTGNADPGMSVGSISFNNCVATVNNATAEAYFDFSGVNVECRFVGGTLYSNSPIDIITDGAGGTIQRLKIQPQAGTEMITINDSNNGICGFDFGIIPLLTEVNGFTPGAAVGAVWTGTYITHTMNVRAPYITKAYVCYRWNPNSASGKLRLSAAGAMGESAPGASGNRYDELDCTTEARAGLAEMGDIDIQFQDDGVSPPTLYNICLIYEY